MRTSEPTSSSGASSSHLTLTATPPFNWRHTLLALRGWAGAGDAGRPTSDGAGWFLALELPAAGPVAVEVRPASGGPATLSATVHAPKPLSGTDALHAARELSWRFALDLDTTPLLTAADPPFEPVVERLAGFHPPLFSSAFAAACWTVIRQRTPAAFARASAERLVEYLGTQVASPDGAGTLGAFPTPLALDDGSRPALLAATNNLRKVDRLRGLAEAFEEMDEQWLRTAAYDDLFKWLSGLPGLGPWSAEQVAWRGLGRYERVPWRDTGALDAIGAVYTGGLTPAKGTARELAERYGWLQGLWLRYLKAYPRVRDLPVG
ncbi:MAG: hypothetical protein WC972_00715 [Trueperaceae bacterium]|nr:hypothetical protein [Trueperaceae bacterium]HRQ10236.1 hypothetical protein [Trueperaceae bacterium]